jgi:tetratricopeptide (TPR) repeat protein
MLKKLLASAVLTTVFLVDFALKAYGADAFGGNYGTQGRTKFQLQKYDEAIELLTKHLRRNTNDYDAWSILGAAYYHTGQPRKALRYLKFVEKKTEDKSYNYYYQGLCYAAAGNVDRSRDYWVYAASRYTDEYAARSTFEVAFLEFKAKNAPKADYWLSRYLSLYPSGSYANEARKMLQSVRDGRWLGQFEPPKRPNLEEALFKYSKLSLSPTPHFWYLQGGGRYQETSGFDPAEPGQALSPRANTDMAALANAAIGIGPIRQGDVTAYAGYSYRQLWWTDFDRLETYTKDFGDFNYFPLRGDLLERKHQIYADLRRDVARLVYFGAFARYEMSRLGSAFFPSPEPEDLKRVVPIARTQLVIPWIGASYAENMRTLGYLYFRKEINENTPEFSNKTYDLGQSTLSLGLSHEMDLPAYELYLSGEVYQYEFIYNDRWLDYKRIGGFFSVEHEFIPRWFISGLLGMYEDTYIQPRLRQGSCSDGTNNARGNPVVCARKDQGLMFQGMVYWNWTQFQRLSLSALIVRNQNPRQKEYEDQIRRYQVSYTLAFPSVKRVARFVDRFADTAFTKEAE